MSVTADQAKAACWPTRVLWWYSPSDEFARGAKLAENELGAADVGQITGSDACEQVAECDREQHDDEEQARDRGEAVERGGAVEIHGEEADKHDREAGNQDVEAEAPGAERQDAIMVEPAIRARRTGQIRPLRRQAARNARRVASGCAVMRELRRCR